MNDMMNNTGEIIDDVSKLNGLKKAAVLVISLGMETASKLLKTLREEEVEAISIEIARIKNVKPDVVDAVNRDFHQMMQVKQYIMEGGMNYARDVLSTTLGDEQAGNMFRRLEAEIGSSAFGAFQANETTQIASFIQNEHPQVAALILSQMKEQRSAEVLSHLEEDFQGEVSFRLASMDKISSEVIDDIEEVIKEQMGGVDAMGDRVKGGTSVLASILNEANISVENNVIKLIEERDPVLAEEIKKQMFLFEDIAHFDDRTVQIIINEMDKSDLVLGLKGVSEALTNKFLKNMSTRAMDMLKDDMDALGPVHVKDVEEAQQRIIRKINQLEDDGRLTTRKMSEDEIVE